MGNKITRNQKTWALKIVKKRWKVKKLQKNQQKEL